MSRAVMQQALDALEWSDNALHEGDPIQVSAALAIEALRAELVKPELKPLTDEQIFAQCDREIGGYSADKQSAYQVGFYVGARLAEYLHGIHDLS